MVAIDVGYIESRDGDSGLCGLVGFRRWDDASPAVEMALEIPSVEPYVSGQFYKRELPCVLAGLAAFANTSGELIELVVIDGNVRLDRRGSPGLGAHLFAALDPPVPVIGVAKNPFRDLDAVEVPRGQSNKPLYVTAAGIAEADAAVHVASMAGEHRVPTLLKRADQLSRGAEPKHP